MLPPGQRPQQLGLHGTGSGREACGSQAEARLFTKPEAGAQASWGWRGSGKSWGTGGKQTTAPIPVLQSRSSQCTQGPGDRLRTGPGKGTLEKGLGVQSAECSPVVGEASLGFRREETFTMHFQGDPGGLWVLTPEVLGTVLPLGDGEAARRWSWSSLPAAACPLAVPRQCTAAASAGVWSREVSGRPPCGLRG